MDYNCFVDDPLFIFFVVYCSCILCVELKMYENRKRYQIETQLAPKCILNMDTCISAGPDLRYRKCGVGRHLMNTGITVSGRNRDTHNS
jgi:hypothetical protein